MRNSGHALSGMFALLAMTSGARAESISGVCPDGSIYIVQHDSQIPCKHSKQVEPGEIPPVRPDYLPKPHTWEIWAEQNDPNNPYNVVDQARQVRALSASGAAGARGAAPGGQAGGAAPSGAESAGAAPAPLRRETAGGDGISRVAFARSRAFEERILSAQEARGGAAGEQVLIFSARSNRPQDFWPNFTFVQEHMTFQPDASNDRQLGVLQGHLGQLDEGEVVLGYIVLPTTMSLDGRDIQIYWDDRHTTARF
jgi:hypothetical protein